MRDRDALRFFDALDKVDAAVQRMLEQDAALAALLESIRRPDPRLAPGFSFGAVQLIDPVASVIETVQARGIARMWAGVARHPLQDSRPDIQSDIANSLNIEEIRGWDDRFDRWIYRQFDHDQLIRVFVPLFLVKDRGQSPAPAEPDLFAWDEVSVGQGPSCYRRIRLQAAAADKDPHIIRLGTVEAGHILEKVPAYPTETLRSLFAIVASHATDIYRTSYVLTCVRVT